MVFVGMIGFSHLPQIFFVLIFCFAVYVFVPIWHVVVALLGAFLAWSFLKAFIPLLRLRLLDHPNDRSSHQIPVPRGGGISFVLVSVFFSLIFILDGQISGVAVLPLISLPLCCIGLLDDIYDLPALWRYVVQLLVAVVVTSFSPLLRQCLLDFNSGGFLFVLTFAILTVFVTAVINFTNFMDGVDGLVAGCMFISFSSLSVILHAPWPLWSLIGSLGGFLFLNWSPAKVFMGDVGSTFLGALFAGLVLQSPTWSEAFGSLLLATPLLLDAFLCVLRRLFSGQRVFQAHRLHLFQRLHQAGWPHSRVSITYIVATAVLSLAMLAGGLPWVLSLSVAELLFGVWLDQRVAVPFAVASKS